MREELPAKPAYTVHPRRRSRGRQTVRDMVFSLGAIGAAVAVILAITHRPSPNPVRVVATAPVIFDAKARVSWPVIDPSPRLSSWQATSARIDPATAWSAGPVVALGYVTPSGQWFGVQQAGVPTGPRAQAWAVRALKAAGDVRTSVLRSTTQASYLIYGTGSDDERRALLTAMGLRP